MHRLVFLSLILVVALDFTTIDAPLLASGARLVQWDDEEESVPTRRERAPQERRIATPPTTPGTAEAADRDASVDRALAASSRAEPTTRLVPIRRAPTRSDRSPSPSEDH